MQQQIPAPDVSPEPRLTERFSTRVAVDCDEAWRRLLTFRDSDRYGKLLEVRRVWGRQNAPGQQTILRFGVDLIDVEIIETILECDAPRRAVFEQWILQFLSYNPAERLPQTIAPDLEPNPEALFRRRVGRNPWVSRISLELTPVARDTDVSIEVGIRSQKPFGWFSRRRWQAGARQDIFDMLKRLDQ